MSGCELHETPEVELFFYDELAAADRTRVVHHLRGCAACRQRLDDLHAIRSALAAAPVVDAPPAGDWSGFMGRLDAAVGLGRPLPAAVLEPSRGGWRVRHLVAIAATLAVVALGLFMAASIRTRPPADVDARTGPSGDAPGRAGAPATAAAGVKVERALREVSVEHLERSKLVVLGLAARDPDRTHAADWQYERELAGDLLPDTRLYRLAAQQRGVSDVARVMRDLETVLLEASMTDGRDRDSLERVQRLITRRALVSKIQIVATSAAAGL